jgi:hypothetical protein
METFGDDLGDDKETFLFLKADGDTATEDGTSLGQRGRMTITELHQFTTEINLLCKFAPLSFFGT